MTKALTELEVANARIQELEFRVEKAAEILIIRPFTGLVSETLNSEEAELFQKTHIETERYYREVVKRSRYNNDAPENTLIEYVDENQIILVTYCYVHVCIVIRDEAIRYEEKENLAARGLTEHSKRPQRWHYLREIVKWAADPKNKRTHKRIPVSRQEIFNRSASIQEKLDAWDYQDGHYEKK